MNVYRGTGRGSSYEISVSKITNWSAGKDWILILSCWVEDFPVYYQNYQTETMAMEGIPHKMNRQYLSDGILSVGSI